MGRFHLQLLLSLVVTCVAFGGTDADAGYLAASIGLQDASHRELASCGACASDGHGPVRTALSLEEWQYHVAGPVAGGMSSQTVTPSSLGAIPAVLSPAEPLAATQLVAWLGFGGKVWLPPAFSTGIFRPPRFVS